MFTKFLLNALWVVKINLFVFNLFKLQFQQLLLVGYFSTLDSLLYTRRFDENDQQLPTYFISIGDEFEGYVIVNTFFDLVIEKFSVFSCINDRLVYFLSLCFSRFINFNELYSFFFTTSVLKNFTFVESYYARNENLWNDGLLIDFLQKKTINLWLRQYVICTGFLFSECLFFDNVTRVYVDFLIMNNHVLSIFDTLSVSSIISSVIFLYFTLLVLISSFLVLLL